MSEDKKVGVGVGVMILKDGKVLLGKRHVDPKKADSELSGEGTWTMPGGKLDYGETLEEGVKREVLEETEIALGDIEVMCLNQDMNEKAHFITIGFIAEITDQEPKVMEPDEITEWGWFDLDTLPSPLFFPSAKVLDNYKQKKFYIT